MRRAAQRDGNEAEIILAIQLAGWSAFPLSAPGWPDLLCTRYERVRLLEVKELNGALTPAQKKFFPRLKAAGLEVRIVRTADEAREALR